MSQVVYSIQTTSASGLALGPIASSAQFVNVNTGSPIQLTVPSQTDTIAGLASVQTLTHKTILGGTANGASNSIAADQLASSPTNIPISSAAPASGDVLTFNGTDAIWQAPASPGSTITSANVAITGATTEPVVVITSALPSNSTILVKATVVAYDSVALTGAAAIMTTVFITNSDSVSAVLTNPTGDNQVNYDTMWSNDSTNLPSSPSNPFTSLTPTAAGPTSGLTMSVIFNQISGQAVNVNVVLELVAATLS